MLIQMKIMFMGTPDFAVFSLKALYESGEDICAVVTQTDKPKGRSYTLTPPPVKVYAESIGVPVYQPKTLRTEEFAELLARIAPELIVVIAFGKILPQNVLDYPKYGCINVHGSLLPEYRGAAPMQRAIIDGKKQTGITIMYMDAGIDTGDMLLKKSVPILENDNFENVHDKLGAVGAEALLETLKLLKDGKLVREKQDDRLASYAAKIEKEDCVIDFSRSAETVHNLVRGLSPIPLAFTHTPDGKLLKVLCSEVVPEDKAAELAKICAENGRTLACGEVAALAIPGEKTGKIIVKCGDGFVAFTKLLPEGKGRMSAADLVNGRRIAAGDVLS